MKDLYKEYFYVPKHGKVKEKVMLARIAVSVVIMLVLMAGMSLSAYAYFTANNTTMIKPIKAAHYQLDTTVIAPDDLTPGEGGVYTLDNTKGDQGEFVFTISVNKESTTATVGFCEILVAVDGAREAPQPYYTEPIWKPVDGSATPVVSSRSVKILVPAGHKAEVSFVSQWGSCAVPVLVSLDDVAVIEPVFPELKSDSQQGSNENPESIGGEGTSTPENNAGNETQENKTPVTSETSSDQETTSNQETNVTGNNE